MSTLPPKLVFKVLCSLVNVGVTFSLTVPFLPLFEDLTDWKALCIIVFFTYNAVCEFTLGRCLGMVMCGSQYKQHRGALKKFWFVSLYTGSFSTLLYNVWFPCDLLLINVIAFQIPCFLWMKNTFHAAVAGVETE